MLLHQIDLDCRFRIRLLRLCLKSGRVHFRSEIGSSWAEIVGKKVFMLAKYQTRMGHCAYENPKNLRS